MRSRRHWFFAEVILSTVFRKLRDVVKLRVLALTLSLGARPASPSPRVAGATPQFANFRTPFDRVLSATRKHPQKYNLRY